MQSHAINDAPRLCPACGKRLSRLNRGPMCFACGSNERIAERPRPRRAKLPHDEIVRLYQEVGNTTAVAATLELPRSSVWYAIQRAKEDGRLPTEHNGNGG